MQLPDYYNKIARFLSIQSKLYSSIFIYLFLHPPMGLFNRSLKMAIMNMGSTSLFPLINSRSFQTKEEIWTPQLVALKKPFIFKKKEAKTITV